MITYISVFCFLAICYCCENPTFFPNYDPSLDCDVVTRIGSGWVCGRIRSAEEGVQYASFRGIPYAQQPVRELRFKELQPLDPWDGILLATEEGPICPQYDELYGRLERPVGMSESCILANVHVPIDTSNIAKCGNGLPILVFVHGGGFQAGSGNSGFHGPEYLVSKGVIVITFNYRINVFGFLSLNSSSIPGNNGLRDIVTLLKWVQRNARAFGGDPDNVTVGGHSSGSVAAHLVSLSEAAVGLMHKVILLSGVGNAGFYTTSPAYGKAVARSFLRYVGINSTDAEDIHDQLIQMPLEQIMAANRLVQFDTGLVSFVPVVEHPGVTRILDDNPANLIKQGRGKDLPMIVGVTIVEYEFFKRRLKYLDIVGRIKENPSVFLPPNITYSVSESEGLRRSELLRDRYSADDLTVEKVVSCCTDSYFIYPALKLAEWRAASGQAPTYLYQFAFDSVFNPIKYGLMLNYEGGGAHAEDQTFVLRVNSLLNPNEKSFPPRTRDDLMKHWMTTFFVNFMRYSHPLYNNKTGWPAVDEKQLNYQLIQEPLNIHNINLSDTQRDMLTFFDQLYDMTQ